MADESLPISVPLRFEIKTVPTGMTEYDTSSLAPDQQNQLNDYKLNLVRDDYRYLASHPEIQALCILILRKGSIKRPRDIPSYLCEVFSRPEKEIRRDVQKILNEKDFEYSGIPDSDHDEWDY